MLWKKIVGMSFLVVVFLAYSADAFAKPKKTKKKKAKPAAELTTEAEDSGITLDADQDASTETVAVAKVEQFGPQNVIQNFKVKFGYRGAASYGKAAQKKAGTVAREQVGDVAELNDVLDQVEQNAAGSNKAQFAAGLQAFYFDLYYTYENLEFFAALGESDRQVYGAYTPSDSVKLVAGRLNVRDRGWTEKTPIELRTPIKLSYNQIQGGVIRVSDFVFETQLKNGFTIQATQSEFANKLQIIGEWYPQDLSPTVTPLVQVAFDLKSNIVAAGGVAVKINEKFSFKTDLRITVPDEGDAKLIGLTFDQAFRVSPTMSLDLFAMYEKVTGDNGINGFQISPSIKFYGVSQLFVPYSEFTFVKEKDDDKAGWSLSAGVLGAI